MYNGLVELEPSDVKLHPGMSALCKIILEENTTGRVIPRHTLVFEKGKTYVFRGDTKVLVEGRFINELEFEVTKGLNCKDKIRAGVETTE